MEVIDVLLNIGYYDIQDLGKEYRCRPLYRPSDNHTSLCIKKTSGEWYDFSERIGGSLAQLVQKTMQLPTMDAAKDIIGKISPQTNKNRYELSEVKRFDKALLTKLKRDHSYWINRGISKASIEVFLGGVASNGKMSNRYVFPIFDERDDIVGFSGRILDDNPNFPKWKHIGAKSNWCYPLKWNADTISKLKEVVLLESVGDMLALWDAGIKNTLVMFGVDISPKVIQFLLKTDIETVYIAFNNDEKNNFVGNRAAEEGREELLKFFDVRQVMVAIPEAKDFGEMTFDQIILWKNQHQLKS